MPLDRFKVTFQCLVALLAELLQPFLGEWLAGALCDQPCQMGHGLAEEDFTRLRRGQRPAACAQHFRENAGDQRLGIDEYAVAVEQHGIKRETDIYSSRGNAVAQLPAIFPQPFLRGTRTGCHPFQPAGQPRSQPAGCGQVLAGSMFFNEAGALIAT